MIMTARLAVVCPLAFAMAQATPVQTYRDPAGRFTFSYPSRFGEAGRGTDDGFRDRVAAVAFSTFPASLQG